MRAGPLQPPDRRARAIATRCGRPGRAELSGTAALLELARIYRRRELRKTLVLVSTSGGSAGFAGARAWAREATPGASPVDAVLVLGDMAGSADPQAVGGAVDANGELGRRSALQRTVESALRAEVAPNPGGAHASGQWVRRALPLTLSGQGVVADDRPARGRDAARPASWPRPGGAGHRAGGWARSAAACCATVTAIDEAGPSDPERAAASPVFSGGPDGIVTMRNVLPDWAVRMLIGTLLLPALLAALDGFFRARRRHLAVGRWAGWSPPAPPRRCSAGCGCACSG